MGFVEGLELQSPIFRKELQMPVKAFVSSNFYFLCFVFFCCCFFFLFVVSGFENRSDFSYFDSRSLAFLSSLFFFLMEGEDLGEREGKERSDKINGQVYILPLVFF